MRLSGRFEWSILDPRRFGLGGSVFTADVARGKRVASRIDTGRKTRNHVRQLEALGYTVTLAHAA